MLDRSGRRAFPAANGKRGAALTNAQMEIQMRNVLVRVFKSDGRPAERERVSIWVYQFAASGGKEQYTDSNGEAEFNLDIDSGAEISVSVNSKEYFSRGSVKGSYRIQL